MDPLEEKIERYLNQPVAPLKISEQFADLPDITELMMGHPVTTDFLDTCKLRDPAIILEHQEDCVLVVLGRHVIPMMVSGFSEQGVGALMLLAYNLKDPTDNSYVLEAPGSLSGEEDVPYTELSIRVLDTTPTRDHRALPETRSEREEARAYCYLAASALRLVIKSEDNYIKAFNHIITGYARFYGKPMGITPPQPTLEGIRTLSFYLSRRDRFKSTLFRILYCSGGSTKAEGMRRFLYEMHLENTGLHAFGIFDQLCSHLKCQPDLLLREIRSGQFRRQISALTTMLDLKLKNDDGHRRKMWRYGRLFDEGFMAPLRTKACPTFAFMLAAALKSETPQTNQNILSIAHFADISEENKRLYAAVGKKAVKLVRKSQAGETGKSINC